MDGTLNSNNDTVPLINNKGEDWLLYKHEDFFQHKDFKEKEDFKIKKI